FSSKLGLTAASLTALMLAITVTASTASAHELKSGGSPSNLDSDRSGYYVWNDSHDIHLDMTSGDDSTTYRGTLHTDGHFKDLSRDNNGGNLHTSISDDGHTLNFRVTPSDDTDGI